MRPKILIVDDQPLVRQGLSDVIEAADRFDVMAAAASGEEALDIVACTPPDLVLLDIRMPGLNGIDTLREMRSRGLETPVVFLTLFNEPDLVFEALQFDVAGFLLKDIDKDRLVSSLETALQGGVVLDADVSRQIVGAMRINGTSLPAKTDTPQNDAVPKLTNREEDVLDLLQQGLENKKIAAQLGLSQGTVRNHISSILQKLSVTNRTQAVLKALHLGLIDE